MLQGKILEEIRFIVHREGPCKLQMLLGESVVDEGIVRAQDGQVTSRYALTQHLLIAGQHLRPVCIMNGSRLSAAKALGYMIVHALMTGPLGILLRTFDSGISVENRAGNTCRKLQLGQLAPEIHVKNKIVSRQDLAGFRFVSDLISTGFTGISTVVNIGTAQKSSVQINVAILGERLYFHAVHILSRTGNLKMHTVGRLRTQRHAQGMQPLLKRLQHIFQIHVRHNIVEILAYLSHGIGFTKRSIIINIFQSATGTRVFTGNQRQVFHDIIALTRSKGFTHMISPEKAARTTSSKFQGIHINLAAAIFPNDLTQIIGKYIFFPVIDHSLNAVGIHVANRIVGAYGRNGNLSGTMHPIDEQRIVTIFGRCPVQTIRSILLGNQIGNICQGIHVQNARTFSFCISICGSCVITLLNQLCSNHTLIFVFFYRFPISMFTLIFGGYERTKG